MAGWVLCVMQGSLMEGKVGSRGWRDILTMSHITKKARERYSHIDAD